MKRFCAMLFLLGLTVCLSAMALAEDETATYAVRVYDENLEPVEGVRFTIADAWDAYTIYTDAEGYASIEVPVSWPYMLRAYPPLGCAVNGEDEWELRPAGENHVLMLETPELIIPLTVDDVPESPVVPVWGSYTDEWRDEEHGGLAMTLVYWSNGTLSGIRERIGQVAYTFEFSGEEGSEVLSGYTIRQASSDEIVEARFDVYGNICYAQAGDLQWSDHYGWFD